MKFRLKHPYQPALLNFASLTSMAFVVTLITWGLSIAAIVEIPIVWISLIFLMFFSLMLLIIWLLGVNQMRRARAFLDSERVIVRWIYPASEWQRLKETRWREEKEDWKVQLGCRPYCWLWQGC